MLQINRYQRSEVPQVFVLQCKAELCCCCCEVLWRAVSAAAAQLELERPGRSRIQGWIFREATCGGGYPRRKTVVGHQGESNHFTTAATECSSFALYMMFHCRIVDIKIWQEAPPVSGYLSFLRYLICFICNGTHLSHLVKLLIQRKTGLKMTFPSILGSEHALQTSVEICQIVPNCHFHNYLLVKILVLFLDLWVRAPFKRRDSVTGPPEHTTRDLNPSKIQA